MNALNKYFSRYFVLVKLIGNMFDWITDSLLLFSFYVDFQMNFSHELVNKQIGRSYMYSGFSSEW